MPDDTGIRYLLDLPTSFHYPHNIKEESLRNSAYITIIRMRTAAENLSHYKFSQFYTSH